MTQGEAAREWTLRLDGSRLPERKRIGGKAWSLARMSTLGLRVPPAFVVTTEACRRYLASGAEEPAGLPEEIARELSWLEQETGRRFGAPPSPLLVSVRSGAVISMPGMMDTVLNLGMNEAAEQALAEETGSPEFARDTHRRFYEMFARVVLRATIPELDPAGPSQRWREAIEEAGFGAVPEEPHEQLRMAVRAVFESWNSRRARRYRSHHGIPDDLGTAVTVQAMVFGNLDEASGTGVLFSRDPLTGHPEPYGEYLARAQGEDVVSGSHDAERLERMAERHPEVHEELLRAARTLEREHGDVQDVEFTVQKGRLYLLQTRSAKRSPAAAVRVAVDMVLEGRIDEREALRRVSAEQVRSLLLPRLSERAEEGARILARGVGACPGIGVGEVVPDADEAERVASADRPVVMARPTTSPEDVHGMVVARAVATEQGGATSHAAVVSRSLGLPCVVGCGRGALEGLTGRTVTVDGSRGVVYEGELPIELPREEDDATLCRLIEWARKHSPLEVRREGEPLPAEAVDLDHRPGGEDPEKLEELLAGAHAARGGALHCDAGVRAALRAGVRVIAVPQVLPALLAACAADEASARSTAKEG